MQASSNFLWCAQLFNVRNSLSVSMTDVQYSDVTGRAIYRENTHPTAVQAIVHFLPKDRGSLPSMGCPLPGSPINKNCLIVPCQAAMALDTPIMCLPLTEGEVVCPPFSLWTKRLVNMLHSYCTLPPWPPFTISLFRVSFFGLVIYFQLKLSFVAYSTSLSGCPLNAQSIKKKHSEEEMMTIKLKASSGKLHWHNVASRHVML